MLGYFCCSFKIGCDGRDYGFRDPLIPKNDVNDAE